MSRWRNTIDEAEPQSATVDESAFKYSFTVFTATHNRAHQLPRVHESLVRQTFHDFEWLIIDDGSTDQTQAIVEAWRPLTPFPIRYIRQAHAGKHVAFNRAVRESAGELFLTLDSDDEAAPEALERFKVRWSEIPVERRVEFSAVTALCVGSDGSPVGDRFPDDVMDSNSAELYFMFNIRGEKWGFQRTEVLRQYPYPAPAGVTFVPEAIVWFAIGDRYRTRYVNEYLRIYHGDPAGPRLSDLTPETARGRLLFHKTIIEDYARYSIRAPIRFVRSIFAYSHYGWMSGWGPAAQLRGVCGIRAKLLVAPSILVTALSARRKRHGGASRENAAARARVDR